MTINLHLPGKSEALRPTITVIGVGGAGGNAVNNMINANLEGVNFVVANTDAQALENAMTERRIQLGSSLTRGLGAGASPEVGRAAAEEAVDEIAGYIEGSNMVFITAGMGGGTGTGAAPVVARLAKERGILTVGVVTKPFQFEGQHRMRLAEQGLHDLQQFVDTLIVIPNQNLFRIANEKTTFADAFRLADEVLHSGVRGVTDLMIMPGLINLDFADIRTVMREMGKAMMGTGEAEGPKRAVEAAEAAISNPLLDDVSMKGAKGVLINITGGYDMTLFEADEAATRIREEVDPDANIIFGATFNAALEGKMRVSVVATGIDLISASEPRPQVPVTDGSRFYGGKVGFNAPAKAAEPARAPAMAVAAPRPVEVRAVDAPRPITEARPPVAGKETAAPRPPAPQRSQPAPQQQAAPAAQAPGAIKAQPVPALVFGRNIRTSVGAASSLQTTAPAPRPAQGAAAGAAREPSFISPQAAQPAQRSFFAAQEDPHFSRKDTAVSKAKISPRDHAAGNNAGERQPPAGSAMNFFQRMAGVGRVLTAKYEQPERSLHVVEKAKVEVTERTSKPAAEEDYLEIPAFLRRQAN
jgi:cell division protein FtsZ